MTIFRFTIGKTQLANKLASKAYYSQARALIGGARLAIARSVQVRSSDSLRPVYLYIACAYLVEANRHRAFARLLRDLAG